MAKVPLYYKLPENEFQEPDSLWLHYGYISGDNDWWDWGFNATNWALDGRLRSFFDRAGGSSKSYMEDSWDGNSTPYDALDVRTPLTF